MNPYQKIRDLLKSTTPVSGEVVSIEGKNFRVMTSAGLITVPSGGVTAYPGDEVRIEGGVLKGRTKRANQIPVFKV